MRNRICTDLTLGLGIRRMRVFDRALVLQAVSADPLDLEDLVGWR